MNPIPTAIDAAALQLGEPVTGLAEIAASDVIAELIADQLAKSAWGLTEGLGLEPAYLQALRDEVTSLHGAGAMRPAAIGRGPALQQAPDVRSDRTAWLDGRNPAQAALFARLGEIQQYLNRSLYLGLTHFEAHFAAFDEGAYYRAHRDSFQGRASRVVSLVLYVNENWRAEDGGTLRVYAEDGTLAAEILPEMARTVFFLSEKTLHEVTPARRTRYSIACWFRADPPENIAFIR